MPAKNATREFEEFGFYHVYNRGTDKRQIFLDDQDRETFLDVLERYLNPYSLHIDYYDHPYQKFDTELIAYCLMDNHFHLFLHQNKDPSAISKLMHAVEVSYVMYFNNKYNRSGCLFQARFKASHITNEAYFIIITAYIHLNPGARYLTYAWSSISDFMSKCSRPWIHPELGLNMDIAQYIRFLHDYYTDKTNKFSKATSLLADRQRMN